MNRKQLPSATSLVFLAAMLGAGCEAATTVPQLATPRAVLSIAPQMVVRSVTGTGHVDVPVDGSDVFRNFSFTALERADGSVSGQFEFQARHVPIRVHGRVTCLTIVGNAAWLGGVVEQVSDPPFITPPGTPVRWRVVDNGQGAVSPPDQVSGFGPAPGGDELAYCATTPAAPLLLEVARGNLQVRG